MDAADIKQKVQTDLVKLLYQQIKYVLWAESIAVTCFAFAMFSVTNTTFLLTWLFSNYLFCGLARHLLLYYFVRETNRKALSPRQVNYWRTLFYVGAFLSGISWGFVGTHFIINVDMAHQIFAVILLMGAVAASSIIYSPSVTCYAIFLLPAYLPFVISHFLLGGIFIELGFLGLIYIVIMLLMSYYSNQILINSLRLRYQNVNLINDLGVRTEELENSLALVRATLQSTTDGVLVINATNKIEDFNNKFLVMWDIPHAIASSRSLKKIRDICMNQLVSPASFVEKIKEVFMSPEAESFDELHLKDGRIFERYSYPQRIGNKCVGRVWSFRDVTGRKLMETKLHYQANYDALTGLPNRALAVDRITQAIVRAKRNHTNVAVMFLDLDRFKIINDTLGHSLGDKLLGIVAERLKSCVRENDTVSRGGGDEFLIVLTDLANEVDSIVVALNCLNTLSESFFIDGSKFNSTTSIGISFYPKDGDSPEVLIRNADIAMYHAKELGRNNFQFFTQEMNNKVQHRLMIENKLHEALERKEFYLLYQPIVSLETRRIVGVEALLHWNLTGVGEISPSEFIPIAEDCGMIVQIGEWALRTACQQAQAWIKEGINPIQIHANLSARQFKLENFLEKIQAILEETKLSPHYLSLELTETIIMDDVDKNIVIINKMKEMGMSVIIDDFGIGYSSLNYLKELPVDKMKIDRSFIHDVPYDEDDDAITMTIISLANNLNLKVIAEGVETIEQLDFLVHHGCDEIQGNYYSKALNAEECTALLHENRELIIT